MVLLKHLVHHRSFSASSFLSSGVVELLKSAAIFKNKEFRTSWATAGRLRGWRPWRRSCLLRLYRNPSWETIVTTQITTIKGICPISLSFLPSWWCSGSLMKTDAINISDTKWEDASYRTKSVFAFTHVGACGRISQWKHVPSERDRRDWKTAVES